MPSWAELHLVNRAVSIGVRLGCDIDGIHELEVRGRRTGKPRRTPVKVLEVDGERYLVSLNGSSDWVRNLRSHKTARLRMGRRVEEVVATEIPAAKKPPIVRAYLMGATRAETTRRLGWAGEHASQAEVRRGAAEVPVFRVTGRLGQMRHRAGPNERVTDEQPARARLDRHVDLLAQARHPTPHGRRRRVDPPPADLARFGVESIERDLPAVHIKPGYDRHRGLL